jgi:hypothetical protein
MYKKAITYTDYNGVERTEDFYFHLSKAELAEMELSKVGGFNEYIQRIIQADDREEIVKNFKDIILKSYGVKDETGKRFVKSEELATEFSQTEAYSELFMELLLNTDSAIEFINNVVPKEVKEKAEVEAKRLEG